MRTFIFSVFFLYFPLIFAQNDSLSVSIERSAFLYFNSGSAVLTQEGKFIIDTLTKSLGYSQVLEAEVYGYTDAVGTGKTNLRLSERRSESVFAYLNAKGLKVKVARFLDTGEIDPIKENKTPEGRASNRRVKLIIRPYSPSTKSQIIYPKE